MTTSNAEAVSDLHAFYRDELLQRVIPFYMRHALDPEHGGYTTCLDDDGVLLSGDKYLWSQGRGVWTFSALYNRIDNDPKWLEAAETGVRFLRRYGRGNRMTRRETMLAALNRQPLERPPVCVRMELWHADALARNTPPPEIAWLTLDEVQDRLGFCRAAKHRTHPGLVFKNAEVKETRDGNMLTQEYRFRNRTLTRRTHLPDGMTAPIQHPTSNIQHRTKERTSSAGSDLGVGS